jgi:hypothetical protein
MGTPYEDLDADGLREVLADFARNWLAHDGVWFQAVEQAHGMEAAVAADREAWGRFAPLEARRIMKRHRIPEGGGLDALALVLSLRMYAVLNEQAIERVDEHTLRFRMVTCRVQEARCRKDLPPFACKPVGEVEFSSLARAVDPRLETRCLTCPPDAHQQGTWCEWEFRLADDGPPAAG